MLKKYEEKTRKIKRELKDQNRKNIYNYIMKNCRIPIEDVGKDGKHHVVERTSHLKDGRKVKRILTRRITDCKDYTKHFINIRKDDDGSLAHDKTQKVKIDGVVLPISEVVKIVTAYINHEKDIQHQDYMNDSDNQDHQQDNNDQTNNGNSDDNNLNPDSV